MTLDLNHKVGNKKKASVKSKFGLQNRGKNNNLPKENCAQINFHKRIENKIGLSASLVRGI